MSVKANRKDSQDDHLVNMQLKLQDERQTFQKKIFTTWLNAKLADAPGMPQIKDLFADLRDGKVLLSLLGVLTGATLNPIKGNMKLHHLNNISKALETLQQHKIKLVGISNQSINEGDKVSTLGLCWTIIYRFQVLEALNRPADENAEKFLLGWCKEAVSEYSDAEVTNFNPKKWRDGYAFNAIIHAINPRLFTFNDLTKLDDAGRLEHALVMAQNNFEVPRLFHPDDFLNNAVDSRLLVMYVSIMYEKMKHLTPLSKNSQNAELEDQFASKINALQEELLSKAKDSVLNEAVEPNLKDLCKRYNTLHKFNDNLRSSKTKVETLNQEMLAVEVTDALKEQLSDVRKLYESIFKDGIALKKRLLSDLSHLIDAEFTKIDNLLRRCQKDSVAIEDFLLTDSQENEDHKLTQFIQSVKEILKGLSDIQPLVDFNCKLVDKIFSVESQYFNSIKERTKYTRTMHTQLLKDVTHQKKVLMTRFSQLEQYQTSQIEEWFKSAKEIEYFLDQSQAAQNDLIESAESLSEAYSMQKILLDKLDEAQSPMSSLMNDSQLLCAAVPEKADLLSEKRNKLKTRWDEIWDIVTQQLVRLRKELEEEEKQTYTDISDWLNLASKMEDQILETFTEDKDEFEGAAIIKELQKNLCKVKAEENNLEHIKVEVNELLCNGASLTLKNKDKFELETDKIKTQKQCLESLLEKVQSTQRAKLCRLENRLQNLRGAQEERIDLWTKALEKVNTMCGDYRKDDYKAKIKDENLFSLKVALSNQKKWFESIITKDSEVLNILSMGDSLAEELDDEFKATAIIRQCSELQENWNGTKTLCQSSVEILAKKLQSAEKKQFKIWTNSAKKIFDFCDDYEKNSHLPTEESLSFLKAALLKQKEWLERIQSTEADVSTVMSNGECLINEIDDNAQQTLITQQTRDLKERWLQLQQLSAIDMSRIEERLNTGQGEKYTLWSNDAMKVLALCAEYEKEDHFPKEENLFSIKAVLLKQKAWLEKIRTAEAGVKQLISNGEKLVGELDNDQTFKISNQCSVLEEQWNDLKGNAQSHMNRLHEMMESLLEVQSQQLIMWFREAEQIKQFCVEYDQAVHKPSNEAHVHTVIQVLNQHNDWMFKIEAKESEVQNLLKRGNVMLEELTEEKSVILSQECSIVEDKWNRLIEASHGDLNCLNTSLDLIKTKQNNDFNEWIRNAEQTVELCVQHIKTINVFNDAKTDLQEQKNFLLRVNSMETDVSLLLSSGDVLVNDLDEDRASIFHTHRQKLQDKWNELKKIAGLCLASVNKGIMDLDSFDDHLSEILRRADSFNVWLDLAKNQVENLNDAGSSTFNDLLEKEKGLQKLSSDLESQFDDVEKFMKDRQNLLSDASDSDKKTIVLATLNGIEVGWNGVNDMIDTQFKSLYDAINYSIDEARKVVTSSLDSLKDSLNKINVSATDKEQIILSSQTLVDLESKASKLKQPASRLVQYASSLSNMTLLQPDEKEFMYRSSNDLTSQVNQVIQRIHTLQQSQKQSLIKYFKQETVNTVTTVDGLRKDKHVYDFDYETLDDLRTVLLQEQELSNNLKDQHSKMDTLAQLAENIAYKGILSSADQVTVSTLINDAVKNIEELKNESNAHFHRVYAVSLHVLKRRLQENRSKLKHVNTRADMLEEENIETFNIAAKALALKQLCEEDMVNAANEISVLTQEINMLTKDGILDPSDAVSLRNNISTLSQQSMNTSENLSAKTINLQFDTNDLFAQKHDEFWGWLPIMQKRSKESNEIGPDEATIKNQLQEMKVIKQRSLEKTLECLKDSDKEVVVKSLKTAHVKELKIANQEWSDIQTWMDTRTKNLEDALNLWEEFNKLQADLLEFLRDREKELQNWHQLDLNDPASVANQHNMLNGILESMELRVSHVNTLNAISLQILAMIGENGAAADNIQSQVSDIHDAWNCILKQCIENGKKLRDSQEKLLNMEMDVDIVQEWMKGAKNVLLLCKENINAYPRIQKIHSEMNKMSSLLNHANIAHEELSNDPRTRSHFTGDDMQSLNKDFQCIAQELTTLKDLSEKSPFMRWMYKKVFITT